MSKYIDADKLKRHYAWWDDESKKIFDEIIDLQPAADVEEVVRCKYCKYSEEFIYPKGLETMVCWKDNADREVNRNGFCEKGERKDG